MTRVNITTNCSPYCSLAWTPAKEGRGEGRGGEEERRRGREERRRGGERGQ